MSSTPDWTTGLPAAWDLRGARRLFRERRQPSLADDVHLTPSQHHGVLPQSEYMQKTGSRVVLNLTGADNMKHVEPDDFVIHLRSFQGGIEHSPHRGKVSNAYTVFAASCEIDPRYYKWVLKSQPVIEQLASTTDQLVRLSWVATVRSGITLNARHEADFGSTYVPYLRVANVKADRLDLTEVKGVWATKEQLARYALRRGDVLMTEGGDRDKLGRGTMWREEIAGALHQNHVFAIRCRDRALMPDFLALLTRTTLARRYFESTANQSTNLASTSATNVGAWRIPLPAPQEQAARLKRVHNSISAAQRQRKLLLTSADLLLQKRNSIIANSVTGGPVPIE